MKRLIVFFSLLRDSWPDLLQQEDPSAEPPGLGRLRRPFVCARVRTTVRLQDIGFLHGDQR